LELTNHKFHQSIYYKLNFFITRNKPKTHVYIGGGPPERNTCILEMILQIYPHYIHIALVYPLSTRISYHGGRWLPVHSVLGVGYGEQYNTLRRMQSTRVPILVTASNECLHATKSLIERTYVW
jgi:hypothetical protein